MKTKRFLLLLVIACVAFNLSAKRNAAIEESEDNGAVLTTPVFSPMDTEYSLKLVNIQVDPLGFLFFGPQVGVDFQIANIIAVGPYVRWNYAGFLYQGFITDWFTKEMTVSPASYGIGVGAKILPPVGTGKHRPYVDIGFEKFRGKESWDPGGTWGKHYYEYKANVFHFGAGYRMITDGSFNLSIGVFVGISKETENKDYYEFGGEVEYNSLEDPQVFPGIQLLLGWQLGGN